MTGTLAAAAAAELGAGDRDDLDPLAAQAGVGVDVALVADDHAGRDREDVVAVVPLLALGLVDVAAGLEQAQRRHVERAGDRVEQVALALRRLARPERVGGQLLADLRVDRERVAIDHRHHRVQVHGRALCRHLDGDHARGRAGLEQPPGEPLDARRPGALAHADEHASVADHEHVAALELRGPAEVVRPDGVRLGGEQRVVAVDRVVVDALAPARPHGHRVDRHAVVDPRRRVAREQVVRQRRQDEAVERRHLRAERGARERQLVVGDAADQPIGQLDRRYGGQPLGDGRPEVGPEIDGGERARDHVVADRGLRERLGQQLLEVEDLDAAVGQRIGERVVLLAGALDPQDVVEQQRVLVARGQALELEVGPVEDDTPQRADLRPDVEPRDGLSAHRRLRRSRRAARPPARAP
jgi:hypothetical protein